MTDSLQSKEIARAGTAPANSQKEFEEALREGNFKEPYEILDEGNLYWLWGRCEQACNALWERKLAAIPSLTFDQAVSRCCIVYAWVDGGNMTVNIVAMQNALRALTANGDVLIRRE